MNWKNHTWIFTDYVDAELAPKSNYQFIHDLPVYIIICEKCNMHGIIRFGYLIITNDQLAKLTCDEYIIKGIIE